MAKYTSGRHNKVFPSSEAVVVYSAAATRCTGGSGSEAAEVSGVAADSEAEAGCP